MLMNNLEILFVVWVFAFQIVLIIHFAVRKQLFSTYTLHYGWLDYALAVPAVLVSLI